MSRRTLAAARDAVQMQLVSSNRQVDSSSEVPVGVEMRESIG